MRRAAVLAATILMLGLAPAARAESWEPEGPQWVLLNECAGTSVGVRAGQPGDALGRPMSTRFSYQWQNAAGAWLPVPGAGSPWLDAGPGPWLTRETGWTQTFASGAGTRVRGVVQMRWSGGAGSRTLVTPGSCLLR